jgi:hypothetical protein
MWSRGHSWHYITMDGPFQTGTGIIQNRGVFKQISKVASGIKTSAVQPDPESFSCLIKLWLGHFILIEVPSARFASYTRSSEAFCLYHCHFWKREIRHTWLYFMSVYTMSNIDVTFIGLFILWLTIMQDVYGSLILAIWSKRVAKITI